MKYIIFEDFSGRPIPIIFPERITFEELREQMPYARALSGGRVSLKQGRFVCSGSAGNLGLTPAHNDADILTEAFHEREEL